MTSYEICEQCCKDSSPNVREMIAKKCPVEFLSNYVYRGENSMGWSLRKIAAERCTIELLDAFINDPDSDVRKVAIERMLDYITMKECHGGTK